MRLIDFDEAEVRVAFQRGVLVRVDEPEEEVRGQGSSGMARIGVLIIIRL